MLFCMSVKLGHTPRDKQRLSMFENRVLRRTFGSKGWKWQETGEHYIIKSFITCTLH